MTWLLLLFSLVAVPLFGAFLLPSVYRYHRSVGDWFGPGLLLLNIGIAVYLWQQVAIAGPQVLTFGNFPAPLGIVFYADFLALLFVIALNLAALILWFGRDVDSKADGQRESMLTLWLVAAGNGLMLSGDLFNIYVFYEIVAITSYGLAASRMHGPGYAASLRYLVLGTLGSGMLLLGIALIYAKTGTLNLSHLASVAPTQLNNPVGLVAFSLMLMGFGVKAELFPLNTWVPEVYATATTRVAALLGGMVSKLALIIVVKLLILLYAGTPAPLLLLVFGLLTTVSGELAALRATDFRQVLAYSSIGQLGLIAIAFSISQEIGLMAGIALALHHAVVKSALFLLAQAWGGPLQRLAGAAKTAKWSSVLFVVLALSLIGVPPLPGFWAKFLLLQAALGQAEPLYQLAILGVLIATVIETAYLLRIVRLLYQQEVTQPQCQTPLKTDFVPAMTLTGLLLVAMISVGWLSAGLQQVASSVGPEHYIESSLPAWQTYQPQDF
jgi:formate hydrogenlyase subunit 3/multisubunit Na+/H+ antiporter MnhD subunit